MEAPMKKTISFLGLLFLIVVSTGGPERVDGEEGPCGESSPDDEALKLAPCAPAVQDENARVPESCCLEVQKRTQNPSCLCAVMLSNTTKASGVNIEVALSIPKRCNDTNRPVGYKCGPYTLP